MSLSLSEQEILKLKRIINEISDENSKPKQASTTLSSVIIAESDEVAKLIKKSARFQGGDMKPQRIKSEEYMSIINYIVENCTETKAVIVEDAYKTPRTLASTLTTRMRKLNIRNNYRFTSTPTQVIISKYLGQ